MKTTVKTFASENDTSMWAVVVDNFFGLFASKPEADAAYSSIGGEEGSDGLAETPFFAAEILAPGFTPHFAGDWQPEGGVSLLSSALPIDISGYIIKRKIRSRNRPVTEWASAAERLEMMRFFRGVEG